MQFFASALVNVCLRIKWDRLLRYAIAFYEFVIAGPAVISILSNDDPSLLLLIPLFKKRWSDVVKHFKTDFNNRDSKSTLYKSNKK